VDKGDNFGSVFDLETLGLDLSPDSMIPGVAVASARAVPLAGTFDRKSFDQAHLYFFMPWILS
jgi:hypothetical protein